MPLLTVKCSMLLFRPHFEFRTALLLPQVDFGERSGSVQLALRRPSGLLASSHRCQPSWIIRLMQWRTNRLSSSSSSKANEPVSVNALLEASRQAQRREGSSKALPTTNTRYHSETYFNPGLLFQNSEDLQIASKHRRQTAGPIPQSWSKEIVGVKKAIEARRSRRQVPTDKSLPNGWSETQSHDRPSSLREECLKRFLVDMACGGPLLDEVAFLPMHIKRLLLDMAPKIAPLNDASLDALLLEAEDLEGPTRPSEEQDEDWESNMNASDLPAERKVESLDLSNSRVSIGMLRQVVLQGIDNAASVHMISRLPMLRSMDLSYSAFTISSNLLNVLSHLPLRRLSVGNLSCNLYLPLQSIALAVPTLEYLDISNSDWMEWSHLSKLDWSSLFQNLTTLKITGCGGLSPGPSFLDPEGKSGGPATVMQAMSAVREAGRTRWLYVIA